MVVKCSARQYSTLRGIFKRDCHNKLKQNRGGTMGIIVALAVGFIIGVSTTIIVAVIVLEQDGGE